jgi:predicted ATPase
MGDPRGGLRLLESAHPLFERWDQRLAEAEAYRVRAELLLASAVAANEAEANLVTAIDVAKSQNAKWFELRAAKSLARLWRDQGKRTQALNLLTSVYAWFTEGFNTLDLQDAKSLIEMLSQKSASCVQRI